MSDPDSADTIYQNTQTLPAASICMEMPHDSKHNGMMFTFRMNDSSGDRLANNTTIADAYVTLVDRSRGVVSGPTYVPNHPLTQALYVRVPAGFEATVSLGIVGSQPATLDHVDIFATVADVP